MNPFIPPKRAVAFCGSTLCFFTAVIFVGPSPAPAAGPAWSLQGWNIGQFQPPIPPGGRANTIAVHLNDSLILVASESGGLFRSDDGGNKWQHVDSLPVFYTNAVTFAKDNVVIVTASEDFDVSNRGGIWRSDNGGTSWTQVPNPPAPSGVTTRFSAYEISIAPDTGNIYIATSYGVSIGDSDGKTWKHVDAFTAGDRRVVSVLALPKNAQDKNLVLAGGPAGIRRSTDGGTNWVDPTTPPAQGAVNNLAIQDMHAFGRSPAANDRAYVIAKATLDDTEQKAEGLPQNEFNAPCKDGKCDYILLFLTTNGGDKWEQQFIAPLNACRPNGGCCGGIGFVKAIGKGTSFDLYVSNRCYVWKLAYGAAKWEPFIIDHDDKTFTPIALKTSEVGDTRDLAFNTKNEPILMASDGGLAKPPDATSTIWKLAGDNGLGNGPNGYNALQIYEVKGQWIGNSNHNLYFGTQDNALWSSGDTGKTWKRCCNEGGYFEGEYRVTSSSDSQITFYAAGNLKLSGPLFTGAPDEPWHWEGSDWKLHDCEKCGHPKIIRKNFHVQGVNLVLGEYLPTTPPVPKIIWSKGLAVSTDFGLTWQQYARFNDDRRDLPKPSFVVRPSGPTRSRPVLYQAIRTGWDFKKGEITHLVRVDKKPIGSDAEVTSPQMNNLGGIGIGPTMNGDYRVFDVDPSNVNHVIAADIINDNMKETTDGGNNWTEIPQLTSLVTDGGKLNFSGRIYVSPLSSDFAPASQASAISFCPDNPSTIAVGTVQNGIFLSTDSGKDGSWTKVPGSEHATLISSLHWRKSDDIIVSTYGRGLWRVKFNYLVNLMELPCRSPDCFHIYYEQPPGTQPSPYDQALVVFGGRIEGARVTNGIVQEVYVRPATTVAFGTDLKQVPHIKVTETTRPMRFQGIRTVPRPPAEAGIITGLTLKKRGEKSKLVGFQFSPRPRSMYAPEERPEAEERPVGPEQPPIEQKPYLEVLSTSVGPGSTIQLSGRGLSPGSKIEIAVDGNTVQKLAADREGKFSSTAQAPTQFGYHSLTLVDSVSGKTLDGAMVSVMPIDRPRSR